MYCRQTWWIVLGFVLICLGTDGGEVNLKTGDYGARELDKVTHLLGQPNVGFSHYAGHVTVNEEHGRALFYWFFEASSQKQHKPLVLWLNGGPGCSSMGYGATQEIGPFLVDFTGARLAFNKYAWNTEANLLFLDSPVGVGFSYSNTSSDYNNIGDNITAADTFVFLQNWFTRFPEYRTHDFYIAGESYGGKYVPELAEVIYDFNLKTSDQSRHINLKGFMVGNPETHDGYDWQGNMDYAWSHAIISDETHHIIASNCDFFSDNTWSSHKCKAAVDETLKQLKEIDMYSLYTPKCLVNVTVGQIVTANESRRKLMASSYYDPCLDNYAILYYNRQDVQRALHATRGGHLTKWIPCNDTIFNNWKDSLFSVLPIYQKLIRAGLRIWVYSGDTDGRVSVLSTRYCINALGLRIKSSWQPWYHEQQVAGWTQDYEGLKFTTFYGAGHAVPIFNRKRALVFFRSFLLGTSLPSKK